MEAMKRRPVFQKKAMELYDVKLVDGEKRSTELIMREAYLDFYSKSLQKTNEGGVVYSKRLQKEQREHNAELEKLLKGGENSVPGI